MPNIFSKKKYCKKLFKNIVGQISTVRTFFKEFINSPSCVGSVCPSSKALTNTLIRSAALSGDGLIIDLGTGSGVVSEELLRAGVSPDRILAIEISDGFAEIFRKRCPGVRLIIGDARDLPSMLDEYAPGQKVCSIISSLPFRVIPADIVEEIIASIKCVINERGGSLVQYTYALWMRYSLCKYGFSSRSAKIVLKNIPPARVELYAV